MPGESSKYFGINVGMEQTAVKPIVNQSSSNGDRDILNYNFGLFGGYGRNFRHLYLGAELGAAYTTLNRNINIGANRVISVKQPLAISLDFIPGYLLRSKDLLFYGKVGLGMRLVSLKLQLPNVSDKTSKLQLGLRAGGGIEYFFTKNFSMRLEYLYSKYGKFGNSFESSGVAYDYSLKATSGHQIKLGMKFNF
jgi:opacity protein-like surface antigen